MRDYREFKEKLRYIHRNPVKRGLVRGPADWKWSSFRHHMTGEDCGVEIESQWTARKRERAGIFPHLPASANAPHSRKPPAGKCGIFRRLAAHPYRALVWRAEVEGRGPRRARLWRAEVVDFSRAEPTSKTRGASAPARATTPSGGHAGGHDFSRADHDVTRTRL